MSANPKPDEFGRYRVEQDTGTKFSIQRTPLDGEKVLNEPASDVAGDALPPEYPASKSLSSTTPAASQAETSKEKTHG